jgi:NADH-quinone oxidoreductase subunit C
MKSFLDQLHSEFLRLLGPVPAALLASPKPAATDTAAASPGLVPPCHLADFNAKGCHLDATLSPAQVVAATELLDRHGFALDAITGVDWMAAGEMEVVYDFFHLAQPVQVVLRTRVPRANPELPTVSHLFAGANWHERETHEFFGIRFPGHPNLSPLLLPEDATYHPLRKDFAGVR